MEPDRGAAFAATFARKIEADLLAQLRRVAGQEREMHAPMARFTPQEEMA